MIGNIFKVSCVRPKSTINIKIVNDYRKYQISYQLTQLYVIKLNDAKQLSKSLNENSFNSRVNIS